jgi:general secretion pathway protein D
MKKSFIVLLLFTLATHSQPDEKIADIATIENVPTQSPLSLVGHIPENISQKSVADNLPELKPAPLPDTHYEAKINGKIEQKISDEQLLAEIAEEDYNEKPEISEKVFKETEPVIKKAEADIKQAQVIEKKPGIVFLGEYLEPWKGRGEDEKISMQFDNADLTYFLKYLERTFDVTLVLADDIKPPTGKVVMGHKINFKSNAPLSKKQAWDIGLTFLELAGFSLAPIPGLPRTYQVMLNVSTDPAIRSANKEPLPTFIGVDPNLLPNNDSKIRYVYLVENTDPETLIQIINNMRSTSSGVPLVLAPMRAIILTDKSANIRSMMNIIIELDRSMPETLSIIRLKHADAAAVAKIYQSIIAGPADQQGFLFRPARKSESTNWFTKNTRVIPEPRTNSLIVLGTSEGIKRFEEFIFTHIDKEVDLPFSPLHIIQLKYLRAEDIRDILMKVTNFQPGEPAAQSGGVRGGEKYFKLGTLITPEKTGNRLIINAPYEDYLKIREVIDAMDVEQPQVAIRVLIVQVDLADTRQLGAQIRNAACINPTAACPNPSNGCCGPDGILGANVNFQTSGLSGSAGLVENQTIPAATVGTSGAVRLLGDLITLATSQVQGTTLVQLGRDMFGVYGLLSVLQSFSRATVIANPFLVATHKYKATVSVGETRRFVTANVVGATGSIDSRGDITANLTVSIIPLISYNDEMVTLDVRVDITNFTDITTGARASRSITTNVLLANREVLALGGLSQDTETESVTKVPILGDIPILGFFFKNKTKVQSKRMILILITPEIIKPHSQKQADVYTQVKINDAKQSLLEMKTPANNRDPIHRWFFKDSIDPSNTLLHNYITNQKRYLDETKNPSLDMQMRKQGQATALAEVQAKFEENRKLALAEPITNKSLLNMINKSQGIVA